MRKGSVLRGALSVAVVGAAALVTGSAGAAPINGRIALDLEREARARDRKEATRTLHRARAA